MDKLQLNKLMKELDVNNKKDYLYFSALVIALLIVSLFMINQLYFGSIVMMVVIIGLLTISFIQVRQLRINSIEQEYLNPVSKIGNWKYFSEHTLKMQSDKTYGFVLFDINNFNSIPLLTEPDLLSECLRVVGDILLSSIEGDETCCHLRADDFVIHLHYQESEDLLNRLKVINDDLVDGLANVIKQPNLLSITWGIVFDCDKVLINNMEKADVARNTNKNIRSSSYGIYHEEMNHEMANFYAINKSLYQLLADHDFEVNYQPILDLEKRSVVKCATSFIWKKNEISEQINHYLKYNAQNQFLIEFDMLFFESVCRFAKEDWVYEINLHSMTYASLQLPSNLKAYLDQYKIKPECIELSMTNLDERIPLNQYLSVINQLKDIGFKINLSDFGLTQSIKLMNYLPIDSVKLSKELIKDLGNNKKVSIMIQSLQAHAKSLNIDFIVDGVGAIEQFNSLQALDVRYACGDYFMVESSHKKVEKYQCKLKN